MPVRLMAANANGTQAWVTRNTYTVPQKCRLVGVHGNFAYTDSNLSGIDIAEAVVSIGDTTLANPVSGATQTQVGILAHFAITSDCDSVSPVVQNWAMSSYFPLNYILDVNTQIFVKTYSSASTLPTKIDVILYFEPV